VTEVRAHRRSWFRPFAVDLTLLVGLFVAMTVAACPAPPDSSASHLLPAADGSSGVELTIDPPSFWMRTGTSLTLETAWSTGSPLCNLTPAWYHWTIVSGGATGYPNATTGPSITFTGDSFDSGQVTVEARAGAVVDCSGSESVVDRSVSSQITVVAPLSVSGVEVGPNPLRVGQNATLVGSISGGSPPYTLEIGWTDSTSTVLSLSAPGSFSVNHTFSDGEFAPYVVTEDSGGNTLNRTVSEALSVGDGFEVAVVPTSFVTEVGSPAVFAGVDRDPPPGAVALFACTNATAIPVEPSTPLPNSTSFSCTFRTPGVSGVLFGIYPTEPGGVSATAVLYETVVGPPVLTISPNSSTGEVGGSASVRVSLSGGAPPFLLQWNLTGNRSGGRDVITSDGGGVLALPLLSAGEYSLGIWAADSLGVIDFNGSTSVQADPPIEARAGGARTYASAGALAQISAEVLEGCPPFSWWVAPTITPPNESSSYGSLAGVGGFSWHGLFPREGDVTVDVGVTDACGAMWQTQFLVSLVAPLGVTVSGALGSASSGPSLIVDAYVTGGWAPFQMYVNGSGNASWNRSLPSDGTYGWTFPIDANGTLSVQVSVRDAFGVQSVTNLSVSVPPLRPPAPGPPSGSASGPSNSSSPVSASEIAGLAVSLALPTAIGAVWVVLRRRRARRIRGATPGPDPVPILKGIIEPAEGSERFTVELLAEEAGIPLGVVRSTIDRLVAQGTVVSESGADGEEVLTWSTEGGR